jgi:hypothetical protein
MRRIVNSAVPFSLGVLVLVVPCFTRAAEPAAATPSDWRDRMTLTLSERVRGEFVDWFAPATGRAPSRAQRYDFFASQLRAGMRLALPHVRLVTELQDTQLVNLPNDASLAPPEGNLGPGAIYFSHTHDRDQGEVFLKQAHLTVSDIPGATGLTATIGRFDHSDGLEVVPADQKLAWLTRVRIAERLIGPFTFTHVTRSFDGARIAYDQPNWNLTAVAFRPTHGGYEVSANREIGDIGLTGAALTWKQLPYLPPADARLFYLYYEDGRSDPRKVDNRPLAERQADHKDIAIHSWGGHVLVAADAGPGKVDGLLWAVAQTGRWGDIDHAAWAYAVEGGYQLPSLPAAPWLRVGYDRSSGDNDPTDDNHRTFFQILPTARMYAQFPFFNSMNNEDLFTQLIVKPHPRVGIRTDYHWLRLTARRDLWYAGGGATNDQVFGFSGIPSGGNRELAHLVDCAVTVSLLDQLTAYAYYGHAFGQDVVRNTFPGTGANYGYVELTYRY